MMKYCTSFWIQNILQLYLRMIQICVWSSVQTYHMVKFGHFLLYTVLKMAVFFSELKSLLRVSQSQLRLQPFNETSYGLFNSKIVREIRV